MKRRPFIPGQQSWPRELASRASRDSWQGDRPLGFAIGKPKKWLSVTTVTTDVCPGVVSLKALVSLCASPSPRGCSVIRCGDPLS